MLAFFMLLLVVTPIAELVLLIKIGGQIGWPQTVAVIVITATVGAWLARREGIRTLTQVQQKLGQSQVPTDELMDGALIIFAAALLLTPGFITDIVGLLTLFPPTRALLRLGLKRYFKNNVSTVANFHVSGGTNQSGVDGFDAGGLAGGGEFRDAEFNEVRDRKQIEDTEELE